MKSIVKMAISIMLTSVFIMSATGQSDPSPLVITYGSVGQEYGKAITTDSQNNVIVAALFQNTINVDPHGETLFTGMGFIDTALVKYDSAGYLLWAKNIGGFSTLAAPHALAVDAADNVYIAGYFGMADQDSRTIVLDSESPDGTLRSIGGLDAFLAKYDSAGQFAWAVSFGNAERYTDDRVWDIAATPDGQIYVTGAFTGTIDFGNDITITNPGAENGFFLAKYDTDGNILWAKAIGAGIANILTEGYSSVAIDSNGGCYVAGNYHGLLTLENGETRLSAFGETDIFVTHFDAQGTFLNAFTFGGADRDILSPGAMRVGHDGNLYLTGHFRGIADFAPGRDETFTLTNEGDLDDIFLASYEPSGILRWAFNIPSPEGLDGGHRVAFDSENNVYVAGWFTGLGDADSGNGVFALISNSTAPSSNIFLAKYDSEGHFIWANLVGALISEEDTMSIAAGLAVDTDNNIYITGQFFGENVDFDPTADSAMIHNQGLNDAFIAKYNSAGHLTD